MDSVIKEQKDIPNDPFEGLPVTYVPEDPYEWAINQFCLGLKDKMILKYRAGKEAHKGEDPLQIDAQKEINEEVLDILNYHLISKVNDRIKNGQENQG
jgi:hypothetical protein